MITFRKLGKLHSKTNTGFAAQLAQYSGARLYAELNGFGHAFPEWIGVKIFKNTKPYTGLEFLKSRFLTQVQLDDLRSWTRLDKIKYYLGLKKQLPDTIPMEYLYKNPRDNINLYGYLQDRASLKLLAEHKSKVLKWFIFKEYIDDAYKNLTDKFAPWVGLHIRRGDFMKRNLSIPLESYIACLEKVRAGRNLIVCSDDQNITSELAYLNPGAVKNNLPEIPNYIFDFWMLKNAQTIIGGGSNFSWWAAFLSNKNSYYAPPLTHLWPKDYKPELDKIEI